MLLSMLFSMSNKRSTSRSKVIISGLIWSVIQNAVNILYGLVAVPFLIGFYGKEEYGLIGLALSVNAYMTLLDMGMANSNVRFFSEYLAKGDSKKVQDLFSLTHLIYVCIGVGNTILLIILSLFVDSFFNINQDQAGTLKNLILILALNATFSWISICYDQFLRANELIDWIKKRATFLKLMLFLVLLCAILLKWPIEWYFFGFTFMGTIILPLTLIKTHKVMPSLRFELHFNRELFNIIFPYALSLFSFGIFHFIVITSRPIFLGHLLGAGAVAEFNVMLTITSVVTVFTASLIQVLLPILTKLKVTNNDGGIQAILMQGTKYITIFITFLILILIISMQEILKIYVGIDFIHLTSWLVLWLLTLLLSHRNVMTALVFTEKKLKSIAYMGGGAMATALITYSILVPRIGVGGIIVGWAIHELIHTLFYYCYFFPRRFNINTQIIFVRSVFPSWSLLGIASIIIYVCVSLMALPCVYSLILKTLLAVVVFGVIIWFHMLNGNDKKIVLSVIRKNR